METTNIFQLLGTTGSLIMCASSVPQIIKTYRMKCADNLSGSYLAILMIGMTLILLYALHVKDIVFIFGNGVSLTLTAILIVMRYRYNLRKEVLFLQKTIKEEH
ncbi:MAG: PQ-loop repeat-containing protein [Deltaproteobacteria bacterium]